MLKARLPLALLTITMGLSAGPAVAEGDVALVAVYSGGAVTAGEYASWLRSRGVDPNLGLDQKQLELLIATKELARRARAQGLERTPGNRLRLRFAEARVLHAAYRDRVTAVEVTPEEVEQAIAQSPETAFVRPRRCDLSNLFKSAPVADGNEARDAARQSIEALRERLVAGEDFTTLAVAESDSESRRTGGRLGWVEPGVLAPEVDRIVADLAPREISPVIETELGFTLVTCHEVEPEHVLSPAERRALVERDLRARRATEAWRVAERSFRDELRLEIDGEAIEAGDPEGVVARFSGGEIELGEIRDATDREELTADYLQQKLSRNLPLMLAADAARELRLDEEPAIAERLDWTAEGTLAGIALHDEIGRRLTSESTGSFPLESSPTPAARRALREKLLEELVEDLDVRLVGRPEG